MGCVKWCNYAGTVRAEKLDGTVLNSWDIILATFSNWFTNELLKVTRGETPTIPAQLYVAVCSTTSSRSSPGTELSGNGYTRVPVDFERVSDIQNWNPSEVSTPSATAAWTVRSFALFDASTGGNYYGYGNLTADLTIDSGKAIVWPANTISLGIGSAIG